MTPEIFLDWYARLAPEGETMLLVWQKEKTAGGFSYIAMLPDRYRPDRALYGNTGAYIVERFEAGKPAAQARYIERVAIMVLDDIGTKSRVPPLEPTWKMETSPGNQQWGYVFALDDQPRKAEYVAAIRAIAEAGYTDPGMTNAVRNFRVPGSINLKPDKDRFASRLIEIHPEREFTLVQICTALGVEPGEPVLDISYVTLPDDGGDIVVRWLAEQHLILDPPNSSGWMGVQCPNCEQHSDGNLEGRYSPATRSYRCLHAHCTDWDSTRFLDWIAEQGGPKAMPGLRQELMATAMASALAAVKPTEAYPDATAEAVREVERQELGRLDKAQWFERFAYVQSDDSFFDLKTRAEVPRHVFNALYRAVKCQSVHKDASGNGRRIEASICFDENRQAMGAKVLEGITFAAGESALVAREGWVYGNRWRNARPQPVPGDVSPWLAHAERMIPDPIEREHVFNVMAHKVQFPAVKINHAVLHAGKPGSGKDTLWAPMLWAIGGPRHVNVWQMKNEELQSQWGYGLESEVMVIQELRQTEAKDRRALENHLKPIIAAPPEMLPVNRKGLHPYEAVNRVFVLAFSNERAAITLPSDDRRWMVIWSEAPRMDDAAARALWNWYKGGGFAHVAAWLHARDVSAFSPGAAPPFTEAKAIMIESSLSTAESFLVDMMRSRVHEFTRGVIGSPFHAVCDRVLGHLPPGVKVPQAALFHALREAGWVDMGRAATPEHQTKKHLFCAPELAHLAKAELRRMVEQPATGAFTVVQGGRSA